MKLTDVKETLIGKCVAAPEICGEKLVPPEFDSAGRGEVSGLEIRRSVSMIPGGMGIGVSVRNCRETPVNLKRIVMFSTDRFSDDDNFQNWRVFRLARQKNDIPGMFRPAVNDAHMEDAAFDSSGISAGFGVEGGAQSCENGRPVVFNSDPGLVIRDDSPAGQEVVFLGFSGQTLHLNNVSLSTSKDRRSLNAVRASAEFCGIRLDPGAVRKTHEFIVQFGPCEQDLVKAHVERVADSCGVILKKRIPPSVYCTWYFYSFSFDEKNLDENLAEIKKQKIPFDVFQIDNGWMDCFGDWNVRSDKFPSGMDGAAAKIRRAGLLPGIWTCPFVLHPEAEVLKTSPDLILKDSDGSPCVFRAEGRDCFVLDPYAPGAKRYLNDLFARLRDWGYHYHKMDFLRALLHPEAVFSDPSRNCAEAYRHGLSLIRKSAGEDAFLSACGGLFEGSAGLVDSNRSGMDVQGHWDKGSTRLQNYTVRIKQNLARNAYNRLWNTDPDALQLRRRTEGWPGNETHKHVTIGLFNQEEAFSTVVNQFISGGLMCASDRLSELHADRMKLYRHVLPQYAPPARYFDEWSGYLPELYSTPFPEPGNCLEPWVIVCMANWNSGKSETLKFKICDVPGLPVKNVPQAAFEFLRQKYLGVFGMNDSISIRIPAHGCRVVRLCACNDVHPFLVGTDMNLSSGAELRAWKVEGNVIRGEVSSPWVMPVRLSLLEPSPEGLALRVITVHPEKNNRFRIPLREF